MNPDQLSETTQERSPLATDLPCLKCGYNLRTLFPESLCPECATPISLTLETSRNSEHIALSRIRRGCIVISLIAFFSSMDSIIHLNFLLRWPLSWFPYPVYVALSYVPLLLTAVLALAVVLLAGSRGGMSRIARLSIFVAAALPFICEVGARALLWMDQYGIHPHSLMGHLPVIVFVYSFDIIEYTAELFLLFSANRLMLHVARRHHSTFLILSTRICMPLLGLTMLLQIMNAVSTIVDFVPVGLSSMLIELFWAAQVSFIVSSSMHLIYWLTASVAIRRMSRLT